MRVAAFAVALLLAGCATAPRPLPEALVITYEELPGGPLCGRCEVDKIVARSDGQVWTTRGRYASQYEGSPWLKITRRHVVPPERFAAFAARLAPYRLPGKRVIDDKTCGEFTTDAGELHVGWKDPTGESSLVVYEGCTAKEAALIVEQLRGAPEILGVRLLSR